MASKWVPMESNPEVINKFLHKVGVPKEFAVSDIHGLNLDDVKKEMPDQAKVYAFLFLFPKKIQAEDKGSEQMKDLFFVKETFANGSGPIALIHAIANNAKKLHLPEDSLLGKFIAEMKDKTPEERGQALEKNKKLMEIQVSVDPKAGAAGDSADFHYVSIICHDDTLYELDGTKVGPKAHGSTKPETFVQDAAEACKKFIEAHPGQHGFSVLALSAAGDN